MTITLAPTGPDHFIRQVWTNFSNFFTAYHLHIKAQGNRNVGEPP